MKITLNQTDYSIDLAKGESIAIELIPNGKQPNHFSAPTFKSKPLVSGDFKGDTQQGGSCNVNQLTLIPHCNGTHTESISHLVNESIAVFDAIEQSIFACYLISIQPIEATQTNDKYSAGLEKGHNVITKNQLKEKLNNIDESFLKGLVVRTLPNDGTKKQSVYNQNNYPAYFTNCAMEYLVERGVQHLLVDLPSVDKMYDQGILANHRIFWNLDPAEKTLSEKAWSNKTITELIFVPDHLEDGLYLCNLQLPRIVTDAVPSQPQLFKLIPS